jgi:L-asparaginase
MRVRIFVPALVVMVAVLLVAALPGAQTPLPRVHMLATGGTISNRDGARLTAEELAASMPGLEQHATLTHEQFSNVASGQITLAQWVQLSKRINALFRDDKDLAGIVVTSGTDTLEETGFFLHLTVRDPRPVVLVGSMRNPSTLGYEGPANLLQGIRAAAHPDARDKGTLVVLNDEINSARDVTKTDALRLQTFQSPTHGVLGIVDSDRVVFFRQLLQRHTHRSEFDIDAVETLPRVDVILTYQGAPADAITAAVDAGARGIVIASVGAGGLSGTQAQGLAYAAERGVFTAISTRTGAGRIAAFDGPLPENLPPAVARRFAYTVNAEDHIPVKARILLMLALTRTQDRAEIQRMFKEY